MSKLKIKTFHSGKDTLLSILKRQLGLRCGMVRQRDASRGTSSTGFVNSSRNGGISFVSAGSLNRASARLLRPSGRGLIAASAVCACVLVCAVLLFFGSFRQRPSTFSSVEMRLKEKYNRAVQRASLTLHALSRSGASGPGAAFPRLIAVRKDSPRLLWRTTEQLSSSYPSAFASSISLPPSSPEQELEPDLALAAREQVPLPVPVPVEDWVLVCTFTGYSGYMPHVGQLMPLTQEVWVTLVPELKDKLHSFRDTWISRVSSQQRVSKGVQTGVDDSFDFLSWMLLRTRQYLGLPHTGRHNLFVEMWVKPSDLFRPCPDPEIDDEVIMFTRLYSGLPSIDSFC